MDAFEPLHIIVGGHGDTNIGTHFRFRYGSKGREQAGTARRGRLGGRRQMSQRACHRRQAAHLGRAQGTPRDVRLERLPFRRRQRAKDVGRRLVADLIVHSHTRFYGARIRRDGRRSRGVQASMLAGRCSSGGTTRITCAPSSVQSSA